MVNISFHTTYGITGDDNFNGDYYNRILSKEFTATPIYDVVMSPNYPLLSKSNYGPIPPALVLVVVLVFSLVLVNFFTSTRTGGTGSIS